MHAPKITSENDSDDSVHVYSKTMHRNANKSIQKALPDFTTRWRHKVVEFLRIISIVRSLALIN